MSINTRMINTLFKQNIKKKKNPSRTLYTRKNGLHLPFFAIIPTKLRNMTVEEEKKQVLEGCSQFQVLLTKFKSNPN